MGYEYFCGLKIIKDWFYQHAKGSLEQGISAYLYHNLYFNLRFISEEVYQPTTKEELKALCEDESVYLGRIDTSKITDMSGLFADSKRRRFLGIEKWDVSGVKNMRYMFSFSPFNHPLNSWNVSKVENMSYMFSQSAFNQPLDSWDVSGVKHMEGIFADCDYSHSLESWGEKNPFK